jgi:small subunit ribosomal protein S6
MERRQTVLETRNYELMFIASPELNEEGLEALVERIQRYLEGANAEILSFKSWGMRRLAYVIKGQHEGRYYLVHFAADSEAVNDVDQSLGIIEGLLRHMVTRLEGPIPVAPDQPESIAPPARPQRRDDYDEDDYDEDDDD